MRDGGNEGDDDTTESDAPVPDDAFAYVEILDKRIYAYAKPEQKKKKNKKQNKLPLPW